MQLPFGNIFFPSNRIESLLVLRENESHQQNVTDSLAHLIVFVPQKRIMKSRPFITYSRADGDPR
jgi:hypothetical protein